MNGHAFRHEYFLSGILKGMQDAIENIHNLIDTFNSRKLYFVAQKNAKVHRISIKIVE